MKTKILLLMICAFFPFEMMAQQKQQAQPQLETKKTYHDYAHTKVYEVYTVKKNTGTKHGTYKSYDEYGDLLEEATYKNNVLNGPYKEYKNNLVMNGNIATTKNDVKVSANFLNGAFHGKYTEYSFNSGIKKNQVSVERVCDKGNIVSETRYGYYEDGKPSSVCRTNGPCQTWFEDGKKRMETTFKDGKENGKRREWLENGKISQENNYEMGALLGAQIEYYSNDTIKVKQEYDAPDQLLSEALYTEAGKKIQEKVRIKPETYLIAEYDTLTSLKIKETETGKYASTYYPTGEKKLVQDTDGSTYGYAQNGILQYKIYSKENLESHVRRQFEDYDENGQVILYGYLIYASYSSDDLYASVTCKNGAVVKSNGNLDREYAPFSCEYLQKEFYKD
jgi:antitoxin component YwqK of YwqJK toxin-antitoxin module